MILSNFPLVALMLLAVLHTEAAIFENVIQEGSPASHQGKVVGQPSDDGYFDPLQQNVNEDLDCRVPFTNIGGRCLVVEIYAEGSWSDMQLYCEHLQGQMLKMDSTNILYSIRQYIIDMGFADYDYWIGGSDLEVEGNFVYLDGTPMMMDPPFWADGQPDEQVPDENCVEIRSEFGYYLNDHMCDITKKIICEQVN